MSTYYPILQLENTRYYIDNFEIVKRLVKNKIEVLVFKKKIGKKVFIYSGGSGVTTVVTVVFLPKRWRSKVWMKNVSGRVIVITYRSEHIILFKKSDNIHLYFSVVHDGKKVSRKVDVLKPVYGKLLEVTKASSPSPTSTINIPPPTAPAPPPGSSPGSPPGSSHGSPPPDDKWESAGRLLKTWDNTQKLLKNVKIGTKTPRNQVITKKGNYLLYDQGVGSSQGPGSSGVSTETEGLRPLRRLQDEDDTFDISELKSESIEEESKTKEMSEAVLASSEDEKLVTILEKIDPLPTEIYNYFPLFFYCCHDYIGQTFGIKNQNKAENWQQLNFENGEVVQRLQGAWDNANSGFGRYLHGHDNLFKKFNRFLLKRHILLMIKEKIPPKDLLVVYKNFSRHIQDGDIPDYYEKFLSPILQEICRVYYSSDPFPLQSSKPNFEKYKKNRYSDGSYKDNKMHTENSDSIRFKIQWGKNSRARSFDEQEYKNYIEHLRNDITVRTMRLDGRGRRMVDEFNRIRRRVGRKKKEQ
jgi:hypothetical protein